MLNLEGSEAVLSALLLLVILNVTVYIYVQLSWYPFLSESFVLTIYATLYLNNTRSFYGPVSSYPS